VAVAMSFSAVVPLGTVVVWVRTNFSLLGPTSTLPETTGAPMAVMPE